MTPDYLCVISHYIFLTQLQNHLPGISPYLCCRLIQMGQDSGPTAACIACSRWPLDTVPDFSETRIRFWALLQRWNRYVPESWRFSGSGHGPNWRSRCTHLCTYIEKFFVFVSYGTYLYVWRQKKNKQYKENIRLL